MTDQTRRALLQLLPLTCSILLPPSWVLAESSPIIMHIIRIRFASGIGEELRAQMMKSVNRFKQIRAAREFIAGRDVAPVSQPQFDVTQIAMLEGVEAYRHYFYDPIHLAADREAYSAPGKPFAGFSSFDTAAGDTAIGDQLARIGAERDAKFKAKDTRPETPPVADRPEDQRWRRGNQIYHVVRLNLRPFDRGQQQARLEAIDHLRSIQGVVRVFVGATPNAGDNDPFTHTMLVELDGVDAYEHYLHDPLHQAQLVAGGTLPPHSGEHFDVIDPTNSVLAERIKVLNA